ncbi:hypothetical protein GH714_040014 [Hevea brasiliensis]|uniref:At1g61320/AtMIF1 LRR domain-containing protein n=1 Tax=Hevea brasiliensis TaxID=3981 RepID=A0A6A6MII4_HEVBR|nr:hypothetical protein GH714_040014 [Hevea brasiliensis]
MINHESTFDIISNLPDNVIDCILAELPIRDAIKPLLCPKSGGIGGVTIPYLVFDERVNYGREPEQTHMRKENQLVEFVPRVLLRHDGPLLKFAFSTYILRSCSDMDQCLVLLSRRSVMEFTLGEPHKLHSRFFSLQNLTNLKLQNCIINPPVDFSGFKGLCNLELLGITIANDGLTSFISSCPLLQNLKLYGGFVSEKLPITLNNVSYFELFHFDFNEFDALKSVKLTYIRGQRSNMQFTKFILAKSPFLQTIIVEADGADHFYHESRGLKNLIRFPRCSTTAEIIYEAMGVESDWDTDT